MYATAAPRMRSRRGEGVSPMSAVTSRTSAAKMLLSIVKKLKKLPTLKGPRATPDDNW